MVSASGGKSRQNPRDGSSAAVGYVLVLQQETSYVAPVLLAVSLPDERLRQEPRALVAERLRPHRQVDGRAAVEFYRRRPGPREPAVEARVADVAPRLAFEASLLLQRGL